MRNQYSVVFFRRSTHVNHIIKNLTIRDPEYPGRVADRAQHPFVVIVGFRKAFLQLTLNMPSSLSKLMDAVERAAKNWVTKPSSEDRLNVLHVALTDLFDEMRWRERNVCEEDLREVTSRINSFYHDLEKEAEKEDDDDTKHLWYCIVCQIRSMHSVVFFDGRMDKGHLERFLRVFSFCKLGNMRRRILEFGFKFDHLMRVVPYCRWWLENCTVADAILREAKSVGVREKDAVIAISRDASDKRIVNLVQEALDENMRRILQEKAKELSSRVRAREEIPVKHAKRPRRVPTVS